MEIEQAKADAQIRADTALALVKMLMMVISNLTRQKLHHFEHHEVIHIDIQWNLSIRVTLGTGLSDCDREVTL